mgnify:CR=1 FL=1
MTLSVVSLLSLLSYQTAQSNKKLISTQKQVITELTAAEESVIFSLQQTKPGAVKNSNKNFALEQPLNPLEDSRNIRVTARFKSLKGSPLEIISWDFID